MNEKTISQIFEEVKEDMCNKYCKYPSEYKPKEHDGTELFESEMCRNCPLCRL